MFTKRQRTTFAATSLMLIASLGLPSIANAANLIANGSFEGPAAPAASFSEFSVSQTSPLITRWTVTGASGAVSLIDKAFTVSGFTITPHSGNQCLDLTARTNTPTGVKQNVATTVGTRYQLNFWVGNTYQVGTFMGTNSTVDVFINNQLLTTVMNDGGASLTTPFWKKFIVYFTATSAVTTIAFINADPPSDSANLLDDVSLVAVAP